MAKLRYNLRKINMKLELKTEFFLNNLYSDCLLILKAIKPWKLEFLTYRILNICTDLYVKKPWRKFNNKTNIDWFQFEI